MIETSQELDHKLDCPHCKTIYLKSPSDITGDSAINCTACDEFLGRWADLERDFMTQGGMDGAFVPDQRRITRIDHDADQVHEIVHPPI